jgi:hypothetical protein
MVAGHRSDSLTPGDPALMKKNTVLLAMLAVGLLGIAIGGFVVAVFQPSFSPGG